MKDIVILGGKGCAKEVLFLLEENNKIQKEWNILGFIDDVQTDIMGYPVLGNDDWLMKYPKEINAVCAIGNSSLRKKVIKKFDKCEHIEFPTIISRHALVGRCNVIGRGTIVCSGVTITEEVSIGDFVVVNIGSTICHESRIENFVTVSPGVNISGNVVVGQETEIGVGAKIIQNVQVGSKAVLGAGCVVINEIPGKCTAVGVPTRIIKQ